MRKRLVGRGAAFVLLALMVGLVTAPLAGAADADPLAERGWVWPVDAVRVVRPFEAPAHEYAPGHRGIDLGGATPVRSPAAGHVAFAGSVAGRAVVTIDHGDGLVTTFEPVTTTLAAGDAVARGDPVGTVDVGGHTAPGTVHFGVRWNGEYVNPLRLLGGVPRAILLPCC
ncbi:M23 family metallopeptidase [Microbacterium enclense]|uniref:murein hydrolase activator EnvC family protein n=1 Tax=Microbacterium enclense TaxID=993073 RepID=UPI0021A5792A|nr:M23 family metallopeptidase [Microbacterium enclense]MCT2084988.1 M23 family metallopeptidase [Microbacterium enclense]